MTMKHTAIISATLIIIAGFFYFSLTAQSQSTSERSAVAMVGDKDAAWILTDEDELIYCWWPEDPNRRDQQARCRVLNKWRVNRLQ